MYFRTSVSIRTALIFYMELLKETLPERRSEYIPTLDGWRAVAISLVLLGHGFTSHSEAFGWNSLWERVIHGVINRSGTAGVILFFSISGFLICTRLLNQQRYRGGISLRTFYIRRCFRILPPAFAFLLTVALLALTGILPHILNTAFAWSDWFSTVFFFSNYHIPRQTFVIDHFLSLAVEEQFYFFWPAMLVFLGNRRAAKAAFLIATATIVWRLFSLHGVPVSEQGWIQKRTDIRLDSLMIPCFLALALTFPRTGQLIRRAGKPLIQAAIIASFLIVLLAPQFAHWALPLEIAMVPFMISLVVITTVLNPGGLLGRILETPLLRWIGRLSYSIYLWQQIVIYRETPAHTDLLHMALLFLFRLPILLALALASYYWIEVPFIRIGRKLAERFSVHASDRRSLTATTG